MPYSDLREYMNRLEEKGELKRIKAEVDWNLEMGAIMRRASDLREPALLFENIKGYSPDYRVLANSVAASKTSAYTRCAIALDLPPDTHPLQIVDEMVKRISNPIKPVLVNKAPCKENILKGNDVDIYRFPVGFYRSIDGGRFIGTWHATINKDPDTGWVNWGMYRHQVHDKQTLGFLAHPGQHGPGIYYQKYESRGNPMPIAIALGMEPCCTFVSQSMIGAYVNEVDIAGGLRGKPVELVKCETCDLEVPATSEIVIEGEVLPHERRDEGPFGEYTGYSASERGPRPIIHVKCITHRNKPILPVANPGKPFDDNTFIYAVCLSAALTTEIRKLGIPFKSLFITPETMAVIVSAKETYPGFVHTLSSAIWGSKTGIYRPTIIVVGDDVDVTKPEEVLWAMTTRMHPVRDIHVKKRAPSHPLFPFISPEERKDLVGAAVCFDATFPFEWKDGAPKIVDFERSWPDNIKQLVLSKWKDYGFK